MAVEYLNTRPNTAVLGCNISHYWVGTTAAAVVQRIGAGELGSAPADCNVFLFGPVST